MVSGTSFCVKISLTPIASLSALVLAIAFLSSCKKEAPEAGPRPPVPVTLGTVNQKDMPNHKEWIGNLQGTVTSMVKPNVAGNIIQRYYPEGTTVKQGEPLFQIDPAPFQADLDRAKADLATAIAQETKVQQDFVRAQNLLAGKVISVQEFQNQQQNYQAMVAQVASKQAAVQSSQVRGRNLCQFLLPAAFDHDRRHRSDQGGLPGGAG